jgi:hypothetical protein
MHGTMGLVFASVYFASVYKELLETLQFRSDLPDNIVVGVANGLAE